MSRSKIWTLTAGTAVLLLATAIPATTAGAVAKPRPDRSVEATRLSNGMAQALRTAGLDTLVDFDTRGADGAALPARALPNVDVAVIELDRSGRVMSAADVLYDRDSPQGYQVAVDRTTMQPLGVEFDRWRTARWDDQRLWDAGADPADVLVKPANAHKTFMVPYPASVLKLMVGYSILRLIDRGELSLTTPIVYRDVAGDSCDYGPSNPDGTVPAPRSDGATDTVSGWFDKMITVSDNFATCVLIQALHNRGAIGEANAHFAQLGLTTLRMQPSRPQVGSGWSNGTMTMGALDTARLLLIVNGGPDILWRTPDGHRVTARDLSPTSRDFFRKVLLDQSFHEVLDPVNLCGSTDAVQGIPARVSDRWIDTATGHVVTYDGDLPIDFGFDVRPCNAAAEVTFAHKTGLTYNAGSDAGIVRALPGQDGRWYIVAVQSNIGNRFGDPDWAVADPNACEDAPFVCYPRGFGRIGGAVDNLVKARPAG